MTAPKELDVPHWARAMVSNYRTEQKLPDRVTDRMIYARLEECRSMMPDDISAAVRDLIGETAEPT